MYRLLICALVVITLIIIIYHNCTKCKNPQNCNNSKKSGNYSCVDKYSNDSINIRGFDGAMPTQVKSMSPISTFCASPADSTFKRRAAGIPVQVRVDGDTLIIPKEKSAVHDDLSATPYPLSLDELYGSKLYSNSVCTHDVSKLNMDRYVLGVGVVPSAALKNVLYTQDHDLLTD